MESSDEVNKVNVKQEILETNSDQVQIKTEPTFPFVQVNTEAPDYHVHEEFKPENIKLEELDDNEYNQEQIQFDPLYNVNVQYDEYLQGQS